MSKLAFCKSIRTD